MIPSYTLRSVVVTDNSTVSSSFLCDIQINYVVYSSGTSVPFMQFLNTQPGFLLDQNVVTARLLDVNVIVLL